MASSAAIDRAPKSEHNGKRERSFGLAYVKALKRIAHLETQVESLQRKLDEFEAGEVQPSQISEQSSPSPAVPAAPPHRTPAAAGPSADRARSVEPDPEAIEEAEQRRSERSEKRRRKRFKRKVRRFVLATTAIVCVVALLLWVMSAIFSYDDYGNSSSRDRDSETFEFDISE